MNARYNLMCNIADLTWIKKSDDTKNEWKSCMVTALTNNFEEKLLLAKCFSNFKIYGNTSCSKIFIMPPSWTTRDFINVKLN
jgi:hypothetical protein